ncbi:MAG: 23S rRNA (pseudouridine(1915)-N(3))-methyltransferase RlmH [Fimbriimonadaceae bacterium]|nr:23S rRNA (pseudouridine(1915)-N(3))-methyltransferase RlmH [Alphaproteobacteria bacterium]
MRIVIAAVSRMRAGPELDLTQKFADRIRRSGQPIGITGLDIVEIEESRARDTGTRKQQEGVRLLQAIPAGSFVVALDENGRNLTSRALSERFTNWRDAGHPAICFLIGGPDGLDSAVTGKADMTLSFGAATWPHLLVRAMLAEQLYRVTTLLLGHPYHRD